MTTQIEDLLHLVATARRQIDQCPIKRRSSTSEVALRQFYADAVNRLARELIKEGYGE